MNAIVNDPAPIIAHVADSSPIKAAISSPIIMQGGGGDDPRLPAEYQRVEYLDFTPDAGFLVDIPAKHMCWTVECSSDTTESSHCIFGYRASSYTTNDFYFYTSNVNGVQSLYRWSKGTYTIFISDSAVPITIGERMTYSAAIDTGTRGKAFIGRYSEKSGEYMGWDGKFYSIKGHDLLTQELTANFVPCYKKADNTIGIYDTVSDTFYGTISASGSGAVAKGPDVN